MLSSIQDFYNQNLLPKVVHRVCSSRVFNTHRIQCIKAVHGKVLEIGIGSGINLPFYPAKQINSLTGIDPMVKETKKRWFNDPKRSSSFPFEVQLMEASAEQLPFPDQHFDHIVVTYTLCTISDVETALQEMIRVLKPKGALHFTEHGIAPDPVIQKIQNFIHPLWKACGGGCHLNRNIPHLITSAGFKLTSLHQQYLGKIPNIGFNYRGVATK